MSDIKKAMSETKRDRWLFNLGDRVQQISDGYRGTIVARQESLKESPDYLVRVEFAGGGCSEGWRKASDLLADHRPHETQATITEWADATFGEVKDNARIAARANEEMAELLRALTSDADAPKAAEEVADVFIVLYRLATRLGVDIHAEIDRKMAVNRKREWKVDGTGHGYHTRQPAPVPAPEKPFVKDDSLAYRAIRPHDLTG